MSRTGNLVPRPGIVLTGVLKHTQGQNEQVPFVAVGLHLSDLVSQGHCAIANYRQRLDDHAITGVLPPSQGLDVGAIVVGLCRGEGAKEAPEKEDAMHG